jgi:uncharacterized protein
MSQSLSCLIIFARYPTVGKVKTRLIPEVGAEAATEIYQQMAEHTLTQARNLKLQIDVSICVSFTGATELEMQTWLGLDLDYQLQVGADLGDRLIHAHRTKLDQGFHNLVIIGTDCPELSTTTLNQAFTQLQTHDLVLGGAIDGGYYLIGLKKFLPKLFSNIPWSTSTVLAKTLDIAKNLGMSEFMLPTLIDVDTAQDLEVWEKVKAQILYPKISIIIPTLNEALNLERSLQSISTNLQNPAQNIEIIIVDGGSSDQTLAIASKFKEVKTISATLGRANQMNLGASAATGEILVFLHADTILPWGFEAIVQQILTKPQIIAGAFKLQIDDRDWRLRLVEWGINWRSQYLQLPYGDQAIFIKSATFQNLGGFAQLPIMEDFELILRLKTMGKIAIAAQSVTTSARRWQKLGIFRTTLINQIIIMGYFLGIKPTRLASWYHNWKSKL